MQYRPTGPLVLEWPIEAMSPAWLDVEARYLLLLHAYPAARTTPSRTLRDHTRVTVSTRRDVYAFALIEPVHVRAYEAILPSAVAAEYVVDGPFPYRLHADLARRRMRLELPPGTGFPTRLAAFVQRRCERAGLAALFGIADERGV